MNEINASESDSEEEQNGDSGEILGKDGYVWSQKPKAVTRTTSTKYFQRETRTEREWISSRHTLEII
jgi:hypothetical protein